MQSSHASYVLAVLTGATIAVEKSIAMILAFHHDHPELPPLDPEPFVVVKGELQRVARQFGDAVDAGEWIPTDDLQRQLDQITLDHQAALQTFYAYAVANGLNLGELLPEGLLEEP